MQCGTTPLHQAAANNAMAVVAALLERGADVNVKDNVRRGAPARKARAPSSEPVTVRAAAAERQDAC
jgi:hypothetical protein